MNIVEQIKTLVQQKSAQYQKNDPGEYDFLEWASEICL